MTLIGIAIVIVASASVTRHDEQVTIDLFERALLEVSPQSNVVPPHRHRRPQSHLNRDHSKAI
jgi:hypothetical protein